MNQILHPASRKRLFLALYLDYLCYGALWGVALYTARTSSGIAFQPWTGAHIGLFAVIEFVLWFRYGFAPGLWLLDIRRVSGDQIQFGVPHDRLQREHWSLLLIATFWLLSGLRSLTAWMGFVVPLPLLGRVPSTTFSILWGVASGLTMVTTAIGLFQLRRIALRIGAIYLALAGGLWLANLGAWGSWAEQYLLVRRRAQNIVANDDEVLWFASTIAGILLVGLTLLALSLMVARRRLPRD